MMKNNTIQWLVAVCTLLLPLGASAQSMCFWTDDSSVVPIRVYIDEEYLGDVTAAFSSQPLLDTEGTLGVDTTPGRHGLTAVDKYGRVYKGWSGTVNVREGEILYLQIRGGRFREVDHDDYAYVFLDWAPVFFLPPYPRVRVPFEDLSPLENGGLLAGMGVAAVGATAAMGVAAARHWDEPDNRFPYVAIGLGTEVFTSLDSWRNVAQFRVRFGNLSGISLLADAGVALRFSEVRRYSAPGYYPADRRWVNTTAFTWSVGAALDYGGFSFGIRYKPAIGNSADTFLCARAAYDWWISHGFALEFHGGFGVGGYGENALFDYFNFPFGIGFLVKL